MLTSYVPMSRNSGIRRLYKNVFIIYFVISTLKFKIAVYMIY